MKTNVQRFVGKVQNGNVGKEEVLWRIHDLGYSLARFGEVDALIARSRNFRRDEPDRADRYGKKYSWIAFFELWGLRSDAGLLEERPWKDSEPHPERIDIGVCPVERKITLCATRYWARQSPLYNSLWSKFSVGQTPRSEFS